MCAEQAPKRANAGCVARPHNSAPQDACAVYRAVTAPRTRCGSDSFTCRVRGAYVTRETAAGARTRAHNRPLEYKPCIYVDT